jgi:two-component system response regulator MtrA
MRILIIGSADAQSRYGPYFQSQGLRVTNAHRDLALEAFQEARPDVIILDLATAGPAVARRLRADPVARGLPLVVLTEDDPDQCMADIGADALCLKPCDPKALLGEVLGLLRSGAPAATTGQPLR